MIILFLTLGTFVLPIEGVTREDDTNGFWSFNLIWKNHLSLSILLGTILDQDKNTFWDNKLRGLNPDGNVGGGGIARVLNL
ncbi:hypothetical protein BDM02DRAFT_3193843 [Thelephora ganbajun]|uniref:Uncharacterized protein n=1 Tax=Thelephora ganbajun TaxID=370292 RepID=A0ACB6YXW7_THEGA|nr:hypothetical protein BDM02DRAFT_3193843 [Thelephora ganbajun]